jgi:hypothetical protein
VHYTQPNIVFFKMVVLRKLYAEINILHLTQVKRKRLIEFFFINTVINNTNNICEKFSKKLYDEKRLFYKTFLYQCMYNVWLLLTVLSNQHSIVL